MIECRRHYHKSHPSICTPHTPFTKAATHNQRCRHLWQCNKAPLIHSRPHVFDSVGQYCQIRGEYYRALPDQKQTTISRGQSVDGWWLCWSADRQAAWMIHCWFHVLPRDIYTNQYEWQIVDFPSQGHIDVGIWLRAKGSRHLPPGSKMARNWVQWNPFGTTVGTEGSGPIRVVVLNGCPMAQSNGWSKWRPGLDEITLNIGVIHTYIILVFIINYGEIYPLWKTDSYCNVMIQFIVLNISVM